MARGNTSAFKIRGSFSNRPRGRLCVILPKKWGSPMRYRFSICLLISLCSCSTPPTSEVECEQDQHCASGEICLEGVCRSSGTCVPDCGVGQSCIGGSCRTLACRSHPECPEGHYCLEGDCLSKQCNLGEEQPCESSCGEGVQRCRGIDDLPFGVLGPCSAPQAQEYEICGDGKDNNCDGDIDEECGGCSDGQERPCETECGAGVERCFGDEWRGCTAARPRTEICGNGVDEDCDDFIDNGCDDCEENSQRECETECGLGQEICQENTWRGCNAPLPTEEFCDGRDNDCDGEIDEEIFRDCGTQCGGGAENCESGIWVGCSAPETCACSADGVDTQVCGHCGLRERECITGSWGPWGECLEEGLACQPGEIEETRCERCASKRRLCLASCAWGEWQECKGAGECEQGSVESEACPGGCGERSRTCSEECSWEAWSDCGGGNAACAPGEQQEEPCGRCGQRSRQCNQESCQWAEWSECSGEGECDPQDTRAESCGGCSARIQTCNDACEWGDYSECQGGGECNSGQEEAQDCGWCGTKRRVFTDECMYGAWSECEGEGECEPGDRYDEPCGTDVGVCQEGQIINTCNFSCVWESDLICNNAVDPQVEICGSGEDEDCDGDMARNPDISEPNNSCDECTWLNSIESPDVSGLILESNIDSIFDVSYYYCFEAHDSSVDPWEEIVISLENIPNGNDYDLYLYQGLNKCRDNDQLSTSDNNGASNEHIEWGEISNHSDGGIYVIRIYPYSSSYSCYSHYRLSIDGLN